jgi:hypothetical protein
MSRLSAKQIVASLLEYGIDPDGPRPGQPDDPWRQSKGPLPPMTFGGRPGPAEEDPAEEVPKKIPVKKKTPLPPHGGAAHSARFSWKPPTSESRALIHELGGHYCMQCMKPTAGKYDEASRKLTCEHCGQELVSGNRGGAKPPPPDPRKRCSSCSGFLEAMLK